MKIAIFYNCYIINEEAIKRYNVIKESISDSPEYDLFWAYDITKNKLPEKQDGINFYTFDWSDLENLYGPTYYKCGVVDVNYQANFPVQKFSSDHPEYDKVWSIEYDAIFLGNDWKILFDHYKNTDADLITGNTREAVKEVWTTNLDSYSDSTVYQSFNPVFMLSKKACSRLSRYYSTHREGYLFFELSMITSLANDPEMIVLDYGGNNIFTRSEDKNLFYPNIPKKLEYVNYGLYGWNYKTLGNYEYFLPKFKNQLFHPYKLEQPL